MAAHESAGHQDVTPPADLQQFITSNLADAAVSSIEFYLDGETIKARIHYD